MICPQHHFYLCLPVIFKLRCIFLQLKFTGLYECTLIGNFMNYQQRVQLPENAIQQAPNVRLNDEINVKCEDGQTQELECCVQSAFQVSWFQGTTLLPASKSENVHLKKKMV